MRLNEKTTTTAYFSVIISKTSTIADADGSSFDRKGVIDWSCADVLAWLDWLGLSEYRDAFRSRGVDGRTLRRFDRAAFTQLGVTRIAHRQQMESSIRTFLAT